jgi:tetratricopeptide (TPR) repeat protein
MYLRGNKLNMNSRPKRHFNLWRVALLVGLIGVALYFNQVVVPATPPLFVPTPTPTHSPESYVNEAEQLYKAGKLQQAIQSYKDAISTDPTNPANYVALARIQVFTGDYQDAIINAQNAQLKNPDNPLALAVEGWALSFTEKYGAAEEKIKQALALDPNSALAHAYYAEMLINQGYADQIKQAIDESNTALNLDRTILETHRARGIVLLNTQNSEKAVDEFKAAIAINKNIPDLQLFLGVAYKNLEQYDLAQEALLSAYALNPTDTTVLTELSRSYFADGKYAQAAQYAEEAVKIDPSDPRLHGNLGITYYKNNDYPKAIPELALTVQGGTTQDGVAVQGLPLDYGRVEQYYWYYGFALAKSNRCSEAVPIAQALLNGVPNDETAVFNANTILDICAQNLGTQILGTGTPPPGATTPNPPAQTTPAAPTPKPSKKATPSH